MVRHDSCIRAESNATDHSFRADHVTCNLHFTDNRATQLRGLEPINSVALQIRFTPRHIAILGLQVHVEMHVLDITGGQSCFSRAEDLYLGSVK